MYYSLCITTDKSRLYFFRTHCSSILASLGTANAISRILAPSAFCPSCRPLSAIASLTSSLHVLLGFPHFLLFGGVLAQILFGERLSPVLCTCPYHFNHRASMVSTVSLSLSVLPLISVCCILYIFVALQHRLPT